MELLAVLTFKSVRVCFTVIVRVCGRDGVLQSEEIPSAFFLSSYELRI